MKLEISVTKKLAEYLGITNLKKTSNSTDDVYHYYADIITKNKQRVVLFMNTKYFWITLQYLKIFKKNYLAGFKSAFSETIKHEGLKSYIANAYLSPIEEVVFTLTDSRSTVSKMSIFKKDINAMYDYYYDAPDAILMSRDRDFNNTFFSTPIDGYNPLNSFCSYLLETYVDKEKEYEHSILYKNVLREEFGEELNAPINLSNYSEDEVKQMIERLNIKYKIYLPKYSILKFISENKNYTLDDCLQYIYDSQYEHESLYYALAKCELFNISFNLLPIFVKYHNKNHHV